LSRVTVTCHARFLGGLGAVMPPGYPVLADIWFLPNNGRFLKI
jgi:hypothetical protein